MAKRKNLRARGGPRDKGARHPQEKRKGHRGPIGAAPGLVTAPPGAQPSVARLVSFDEKELVEGDGSDLDVVRREVAKGRVVWIDIVGLGSAELIQGIGRIFDLHPLALEDAMHTHQRPKIEEYPFGHYLSIRVPQGDPSSPLDLEQISIFFGPRFVVTVQEDERDCFEPVRERIRKARGSVRRLGADYLAYALIDAGVDAYFPHVEAYGDRLEALEDRILAGPEAGQVGELHAVKRDLFAIRRAVWPFREEINALVREEHPNIAEETRLYLRDVYDHTIQLVELLEAHRDIAGGLLDVYLSSVSNRMNEVMKLLTIISTIFIPLSFVASLYGMNFDRASPFNMPELGWRYGYPFALLVMGSIALGLVVFFRKKRWL